MELENLRFGTELLKRGFAKMQKGGVIMDVTTPEQAVVAEEAGAVAVMALHAVPADIRKMGGVARMADPAIIEAIIEAVTIPVMAKARIGHFVEAQILEALGVDMVDESEVLTPVDEFHIAKTKFAIPFVCGARNLGEACRRIKEGAAMIRTKGEAGTGDVSQAVLHMRMIQGQIRSLKGMDDLQLLKVAREIEADLDLVSRVRPHATSACGELCCRRRGYTCRCRLDDAAWGRWSLRGIRHIQVRKSCGHGRGHRSGSTSLRRCKASGQGIQRPGRGHEGTGCRHYSRS